MVIITKGFVNLASSCITHQISSSSSTQTVPPLYSSSSVSLWPVFLAINELQSPDRYECLTYSHVLSHINHIHVQCKHNYMYVTHWSWAQMSGGQAVVTYNNNNNNNNDLLNRSMMKNGSSLFPPPLIVCMHNFDQLHR